MPDGRRLGGRILVADDDPADVAWLRRVLRQGGHDDLHATTEPEQLTDLLSRLDPDLLVLDWQLSPAGGADVLVALRADPRWEGLPVIVATGDATARSQALDLGATDLLTRPFDDAEVLLRVRNVLRARMLQQRLQRSNDELERRVRERTLELEATNEALRQAETVRRDFVAMASHELRTPLTVIRGFVELWSQRGVPAPDDAGRQVTAVRRNVRRMEHLVQNLLLASRVESGGDSHRRRVFALCDVLDPAALDDFTQHRLSVRCEDVGRFEGDPELLRVVLANLVANADRYGGPPIEVRAAPVPGGAEVTVTDGGPGVPDDFVPHLFERFRQATHGDRRSAQGAGLGLWVARHIVEQHGGRLWYEPAPSGGARFTLRLPLPEFRTT